MSLKLLTDSMIYGLGRVATMAIAIFLLPLYSRLFSQADYGVLESFKLFTNFCLLVFPSGLSQAIYSYIYTDEYKGREKNVYSAVLWYYVSISIIFGTVFGSLTEQAGIWIVGEKGFAGFVLPSVLTIAFSLINGLFLDIARSQEKKYQFLVLSVGNGLAVSLGGVVAVVWLNSGLLGFFWASALSSFFFLLLGMWLSRPYLDWTFDRQTLKALLRFGMPLVPAGAAIMAMKFADRMIVQRLLGLNALGIYAMGTKISSAFDIVGLGFSMAWHPLAMRRAQTPAAADFFRAILPKICAAMVVLATLFMALVPFVYDWAIDPKFADAEPITYWLLFGGLCGLLVYVTGIGLHVTKRSSYILTATAVGGVVNVLLAVVLGKWIGLHGIAIAVPCGMGAYASLSSFYAERFFPVGHRWYSVVTAFALLLGIVIGMSLYNGSPFFSPASLLSLACLTGAAIVAVKKLVRFYKYNYKLRLCRDYEMLLQPENEVVDWSDQRPTFYYGDLRKCISYLVENQDPSVPTRLRRDGRELFHPTLSAERALVLYDSYLRTGDPGMLSSFRVQLDDIVSHADRSEEGFAKWYFSFSLDSSEPKSAWTSSISQGIVMSALVRGRSAFGEVSYIELAQEAFAQLDRPRENGGNMSCCPDVGLWYEEDLDGTQILNGHIYALLGIYDLYRVTGNANLIERFRMGCKSVEDNLEQFDTGFYSCYDRKGGLCNKSYHFIDINLLKILIQLGQLDEAEVVTRRWQRYVETRRGRWSLFWGLLKHLFRRV